MNPEIKGNYVDQIKDNVFLKIENDRKNIKNTLTTILFARTTTLIPHELP